MTGLEVWTQQRQFQRDHAFGRGLWRDHSDAPAAETLGSLGPTAYSQRGFGCCSAYAAEDTKSIGVKAAAPMPPLKITDVRRWSAWDAAGGLACRTCSSHFIYGCITSYAERKQHSTLGQQAPLARLQLDARTPSHPFRYVCSEDTATRAIASATTNVRMI